MELKTVIRGVFLDFIKVVGNNEHTYRGTPIEMINALSREINQSISDYNDSLRP